MITHYPRGSARALLETDAVSNATREAIRARLERPLVAASRFFSALEMSTLRAICSRLIPQPERQMPIDLAAYTDERLAKEKGNGWRYDIMPPDGEAFRQGLRGLEESARILFHDDFVRLDGSQQDAVLCAIQNEYAPGDIWKKLCGPRFFEELLAEVVENYYAHPLAQDEIGYAGYADVPGWSKIGLNEREDREPLEINHD